MGRGKIALRTEKGDSRSGLVALGCSFGKPGVNTLWDRQVALSRGGMFIPGGEREAPGEERKTRGCLKPRCGGVSYKSCPVPRAGALHLHP